MTSRRPLDPASLKPDQGPGVRSPEAQDFLDSIDELRGSRDFDWADDTLRGIYDTVTGSGQVTPGQERAVRNIAGARRWER